MAQEGTKAYEQAVKEGDTFVFSEPKDAIKMGLRK